MASSRQIEHLERKHKENPEGLTFAPLANAYRNSGQPERAIEVLMQGLEHHPDHAPARIVLGRCHLDLGDDVAAETAFAQVFDLDKENVVALKALADITERDSRFEDAARWLAFLLDADRNNEEARQQLERVTAAKAVAEASEADETVGSPSEATVDEVEPATLDSPSGGAEVAAEETADEDVSQAGEPSIEPPPSPWEPPSLASEVTEGLSDSGPDGPGGPLEDASAADSADTAPAEPLSAEDTVPYDFAGTFETEDDITLTPAAHNEFQGPDAAAGLSLDAGGGSEFQVEQEGEVELRGSADNEFQPRSDAGLLLPSEEDSGEEPISFEGEESGEEEEAGEEQEVGEEVEAVSTPEHETARPNAWFVPASDEAAAAVAPESGPDGTPEEVEAGSTTPDHETAEPGEWFVPAADEAAAAVAPESGPDGTPEPLEEVFGAEPGAQAEPPFEESEPLPGPWKAAGDVEDMIQAETDEPSPVEESEPLPGPGEAAGDVEDMNQAEADEPSPVRSDGVSEDESVAQPEVTSQEEEDESVAHPEVTSEEEEEEVQEAGAETKTAADAMVADVSPDVLGSDEDPAPAVAAEPTAWASPELAPEPEPESETEPAFVATETMAEVFLSQGHRGQALEIYRALLQSTPGDTRLSEKVNALETELEGGVVAGEQGEPAAATDGSTVESGSSYAVSATGGQTVKAMLRGLLASKPAAPAPPEAIPAPTPPARNLAGSGPELVGEPTRPAQEPLSLSSIFGEDASPVPPALGGGPAKAETDEGFSFDSFFGDETGSVSKRPSESRPKGREDEEDLDQFQSWLQGLKG